MILFSSIEVEAISLFKDENEIRSCCQIFLHPVCFKWLEIRCPLYTYKVVNIVILHTWLDYPMLHVCFQQTRFAYKSLWLKCFSCDVHTYNDLNLIRSCVLPQIFSLCLWLINLKINQLRNIHAYLNMWLKRRHYDETYPFVWYSLLLLHPQ